MDISSLQQQLEAEQKRLEKDLQDLGIQNPTAPEDWIATPQDPSSTEADPNLVADRTEDWQAEQAEVDALETRLNNVKRALEKITSGRYGVCEISGEPIEEDRLQANPAARTNKAHMNEEKTLPH